MKIKDLIKKLELFNQNSKVFFECLEQRKDIQGVSTVLREFESAYELDNEVYIVNLKKGEQEEVKE